VSEEYVAVSITVIARIPGREFREERVFYIPKRVLEECEGRSLQDAFSVVNCVEWYMRRAVLKEKETEHDEG